MRSLLLTLSDNSPKSIKDEIDKITNLDWLKLELKMLFLTSSRNLSIGNILYINSSILNYGIDTSISKDIKQSKMKEIIADRIIKTLERFEPRLTNVTIFSDIYSPLKTSFKINSFFENKPFEFILIWDNCAERFYFDE